MGQAIAIIVGNAFIGALIYFEVCNHFDTIKGMGQDIWQGFLERVDR